MNLDIEMKKEIEEMEKKMGSIFVERHLNKLSDKSVEDIIQAYIKWRHNRYITIEDPQAFFVIDTYDTEPPVAMFLKSKDPDAFNHAWLITEKLNDLPNNIVSIGGKLFEYENIEFNLTEEQENNIQSTECDFTIDDVIKNNKKEEN